MKRIGFFLMAMFCASPALAGPTTITIADTTGSTTGSPQYIAFPLTRSGDPVYDVWMTYHTVDGTAVAPTDYAGGSYYGLTDVPIYVLLSANTAGGPALNFQVQLDSVVGVGPALSFASQVTFATGMQPGSVNAADLNGDGKPDLLVSNYGDATVSVLLNTTTPGVATPNFASQQTFATGLGPTHVIAADVNNDGKPDLIVSNGSANTVSVLLNTTAAGATTFTFAPQQSFNTGTDPVFVAAGDVNGDGKLDLIAVNYGGTVSVLLNTTAPGAATPTFSSQQTFAAGTDPLAVAVADLNGDGRPDLAVANQLDGTISVLLNITTPGAATANFAAQQVFAAGGSPESVSAVDMNGDGKPDLLIADYDDNAALVLLNGTVLGNTTAVFAPGGTLSNVSGPYGASAADFNGDGKQDVITVNAGDSTISAFLNTTASSNPYLYFFAPSGAPTFATGTLPTAAAIADINGDGRPDAIISNYNDNTVSVLLNNTAAPTATSPAFTAQQTFATGANPAALAMGDLNGDGRPDVVVANSGNSLGNTISVFFNTTASGAVAPSFATQQVFTTGGANSDPVAVALADLNGDGRKDVIVVNEGGYVVATFVNLTAPGASTPGFLAAQTFVSGTLPTAVAVGDLNNDGKPDLAVTISGSSGAGHDVWTYLNTTAPGATTLSFSPQLFTVGTNPQSVAIADVNNDGKPDLIVANGNDNTVSVLLNTTAPGASTAAFAAQQTFAVGGYPSFVTAADINGDGRIDLLIADESNTAVDVLLNSSVPGAAVASFVASQNFDTGTSGTQSLAVTDVDGDGRPDVVAAGWNNGTLTVLINITTPGSTSLAFLAAQPFANGADHHVAVADVNGDGRPDLIATEFSGNDIAVLLSTQYQASFSGSPATGTILHPAKLVLTQEPGSSYVSNGAITVKVSVEDSSGTLVDTDTSAITLVLQGGTSGATLSGTKTVGAANGVATFANLKVDKVGTAYMLHATDGGLVAADSSAFNITPGVAAKLVFTTQPPASSQSNAVFGATVKIEDAAGNVVTNNASAVTLALTGGTGGAALSGTKTVNAVNGAATFTNLAVDKVGASYKVHATDATLAAADSTAFKITPGTAAKLVFTTQPAASSQANATFGAAVKIEDSAGNVVTGNTSTVTLVLSGGTAGSTLGGGSAAAVAGVATFSNLNVDKSGAGYKLHATDASLVAADSSAFNITPGTAAKLVFTAQPPASFQSNAAFGAAVKIEDAAGNVVTNNTSAVTLALTGGTSGAMLSGTKTVNAVAGLVTFTDLKVDKVGMSYRLHATDGGLSGADSSVFNVTPGAASRLVFQLQPSTALADATMTPAVKIQIQDVSGNPVFSSTAPVTLAIGTNPGSATLGGAKTVNALGGIATFNSLTLDAYGIGYKLTAASSGLTSATSNAFDVQAKLAFTTQPTDTIAGSVMGHDVVVQMRNANGSAIGGAPTIALTENPSGEVASSTSAANGVATFSGVTLYVAGSSVTLTASGPGLISATSALFNVAAGAPSQLAFAPQPGNAVVNVAMPAFGVRILDANNNLTASAAPVTIALGSNPTGAALSGTKTVTAIGGVASFGALVLNKLGTGYTLKANVTGATGTTSSAFNVLNDRIFANGFQ